MNKTENFKAFLLMFLMVFNVIIMSFLFNYNKSSGVDDIDVYERQEPKNLKSGEEKPQNEINGLISDRNGKIFTNISVSNPNRYINRYQSDLDIQPNLFLQDWNITHANMIFTNLNAVNYTKDIETSTTEFIYSSIHGPIYFYQKFSVELSQYVNNVSVFIQDINNPTLFTDENSWEVAIVNCSNDNQGSPNTNNTLGQFKKPHPIVYAAHWEVFDFKNSDNGAIFLDVSKTNWTVEDGTTKYWFAMRIKIPPDDTQTLGGPKFLYFSPDGEDSSDKGEGDTFAINPSFFTDKYYTNHAVENVTAFGNHTEYYSQFYVGNLSSFEKMDEDRYFAESNISASLVANLTKINVKFNLKELSGNGITFEDISDKVKRSEMNWWEEHYRYVNNFNISYALNCSIENIFYSLLYLKNSTGGFDPIFRLSPMNSTTEELFEIVISDPYTKLYIINNYINFTDNNSITFQFVLANNKAFNTTINQLTVKIRELPVLTSMIPHDPLLQDLTYASDVSVVNGTTTMSITDAVESLNTIDEKRYNVTATTTNISIEFKFNVLTQLDSSIFNVTDLEDWVFLQPNPIVPQIDIRITSNISVYNKNSLNESVLEIYKGDINNTYFTAIQNSSSWIRLDELGNNSYAFNQETTNITYLDPFTTWIFMQLVNVSDDNSIIFRLRYVGNETFQNFNISINEFALIIYVQNAISSDITSKIGFGLNSNSLTPFDIKLQNFGTTIPDNGLWEMDISNGVPVQGFYNFNVTSLWPEVRFDVSGIYTIENLQSFTWDYYLGSEKSRILWNASTDITYYSYYNNLDFSQGLQFNIPSDWLLMDIYNDSNSPPSINGGWYSTIQSNNPFKSITVYNISDGSWKIGLNSSKNLLLLSTNSTGNAYIDKSIDVNLQIQDSFGGTVTFEVYNDEDEIIYEESSVLDELANESSDAYIWDIFSTTNTPGTYYLKGYWIVYNDTHAFLSINTTEIVVSKYTVDLQILNIEEYSSTYIYGNDILIRGRLRNHETGVIIEGESIIAEIYDNDQNLIETKSDITNSRGIIQIEYSLPSGYGGISIQLVYNASATYYSQGASIQNIEFSLISQADYNFGVFMSYLPCIVAILGIMIFTVGVMKYRKGKLRKIWADEAIVLDDLVKISYILVISKEAGLSIYHKQISFDEVDSDLISGFLQAISSFKSEIKKSTTTTTERPGFEMDYVDFKIVITDGAYVRVALVLEGKASDKLKENQWSFTDNFEKRFVSVLQEFDGDITPFKQSDDLVEKYFNISLVYPLKLGRHYGIIKLKGLEKDLIEMASEIQKERKVFFISSLLNLALAARKATRDEIISTILSLREKGLIVPVELE